MEDSLPPPQFVQPSPALSAPPPARSALKTIVFVVLVLVVLVVLGVVGGGIAYAYQKKLGTFSRLPYTEGNLVSGILDASSKINSSTYSMAGSIAAEPRDEGALPFTLQVSNAEKLREQYQNDYNRIRTTSSLLSYLRKLSPYPSTLEEVQSAVLKKYPKSNIEISTTDPITGAPLEYRATNGGQDFELSITFETKAAITALNRYAPLATSTIINGMKATFTEGSYSYFYMSSEPPKPWLVQMGEMARYLPPEINAQMSVTAAANWDKQPSDWRFTADATGDFGDLTYKFNLNVLKKDKYFYFRVNNIPSLFLSYIEIVKGEWVKIDPTATSTSNRYSSLGYLATSLPKSEESYQKSRAEWTELLKKAAQFADEERLFAFKNVPHSETVDGRLLYRYDIKIRKEAILSFYEKLATEASSNQKTAYASYFNDQGMVEYLQSAEFDQIFDYYDKNTSLTLYVDPLGYPAIIEQSARLIPPDTATQLADKQAKVVFRLILTDINKAVIVEEPKGAKMLEEMVKAVDANRKSSIDVARGGGKDAATKANLSGARAQAEIYYNANKNSYAGVCNSGVVNGTRSIYSLVLLSAQNSGLSSVNTTLISSGSVKSATCHATARGFAAEAPLIGGGTYCVDSTGVAKNETTFGIAANSVTCK